MNTEVQSSQALSSDDTPSIDQSSPGFFDLWSFKSVAPDGDQVTKTGRKRRHCPRCGTLEAGHNSPRRRDGTGLKWPPSLGAVKYVDGRLVCPLGQGLPERIDPFGTPLRDEEMLEVDHSDDEGQTDETYEEVDDDSALPRYCRTPMAASNVAHLLGSSTGQNLASAYPSPPPSARRTSHKLIMVTEESRNANMDRWEGPCEVESVPDVDTFEVASEHSGDYSATSAPSAARDYKDLDTETVPDTTDGSDSTSPDSEELSSERLSSRGQDSGSDANVTSTGAATEESLTISSAPTIPRIRTHALAHFKTSSVWIAKAVITILSAIVALALPVVFYAFPIGAWYFIAWVVRLVLFLGKKYRTLTSKTGGERPMGQTNPRNSMIITDSPHFEAFNDYPPA